MPQRAVWLACTLAIGFALTGCGDSPTSDHRGYTKAPLETLTVFIKSEQPSEVRAFARFNRPDGQRINTTVGAEAGSD